MALANAIDPEAWERASDYALEAVSIARRMGDDATLLVVLNGTGMTLGQPDRLDQRMEQTLEAIALADRLGDRAASFQARFERRNVLIEALRFDEADAILQDLVRMADETRLPFSMWQCEIVVVGRETELGHLDTAEALAEATMALGTRTGVVEALASYGGQLHDIRMAQGRRQEIAQLFIDAATQYPTIASLRNAAIGLCFEIGDVAEARRRYEDEVARGFSYPRTSQWLGAMEGAVDGNLAVGDQAGAAILYEQLLPYADRAVYQIATPARPVARSLGCLAAQARPVRRSTGALRERARLHGAARCCVLDRCVRCSTTPISASHAVRRETASRCGTLRLAPSRSRASSGLPGSNHARAPCSAVRDLPPSIWSTMGAMTSLIIPADHVEPVARMLRCASTSTADRPTSSSRCSAPLSSHLWQRPDLELARSSPGPGRRRGARHRSANVRRRCNELMVLLELARHPADAGAGRARRGVRQRALDAMDGPSSRSAATGSTTALRGATEDFDRFYAEKLPSLSEPSLRDDYLRIDEPDLELARAPRGAARPRPTAPSATRTSSSTGATSSRVPGADTHTPAHYVSHDMNHVIAGYEPTGPGEIALGAFTLAMHDNDANWIQFIANLASTRPASSSTARSCRRHATLSRPGATDLMGEAFWRGAQCTADFSQADHLTLADWQLADVRAHFGVPAADLLGRGM